MNTFDINSNFEGFIVPPYTDRDASMIFLSFESEEQYELRLNENPKTHCNWLKKDTIKMTSEPLFGLNVVTNIAGKPKNVNTQDTIAVVVRSEAALTKKRRVNKASIKCGCTARIVKKMLVNKMVENAIAAHCTKLSRKHTNVIRSEKGYMAEYIQYPGEGAPFLIHWMSSWKMNILSSATEWCINYTHKTCKSLDGKNDAYLFTIVVISPVNRKGSIIIDCSATEIAAIREAFGADVDVLLCHRHIKRGWEAHIKRDVLTIKYDVEGSKLLLDFVGYFNAFKDKFEIKYTIFYSYFMNQWMPKKDLWSKVYREVKSELRYT
ncbi:hypothetical protein BD770DRAFT_387174 [Pilaira anomala]|nr:hypothetical protein BD770DRAFT_387174 [Pilaira anomala]